MNRILLSTLLFSTLTLPTLAQNTDQSASAEANILGNNNTVNQTINQTIIYHPGIVNRRENKEKTENRGQSRSRFQGEETTKKKQKHGYNNLI